MFMAQSDSEFEKLKREVLSTAEDSALAASAGSPAVPLEKIAATVGISSIRVEPLLSLAGLEVLGQTFVIWLNADARQVNLPENAQLDLNDARWRTLSSSIRFHVAHEIAHALFIKRAGRSTMLDKEIDELERACDEAAGIMLLPKQRLRDTVGEKILSVGHVWGVIQSAQVTPETFIHRLRIIKDEEICHEPRGGVLAVVREEAYGLDVAAYHSWGTFAKVRFGDSRLPRASDANMLKSWRIDDSVNSELWQRDEYSDDKMQILSPDGANYLPCELRIKRVHREKPRGFLLSLRILGQAMRTGVADVIRVRQADTPTS
jgi:hypothetical protein